jgi:CHAD domain-containing protein
MAPDTTAMERETKFDTDLVFALPDLRGIVARTVRLPELSLRAAYFDTADFRLWRRGITLRHRIGEGPEEGLWTLKLPATSRGATLNRSELTWAGVRESVPPEAARILTGLVRRSALNPVVELATTRVRLALVDDEGVHLGEVDDDSVTVIGGRRDGLRFRQIEVELDDGGEAVIDAVVTEFRRAGVRPGYQPKLARAAELPRRSRRGSAARLGRRSSLGAVVTASLGDGLDRLLDHDYRLRLGPTQVEPHDVHQARVATRRLRSDLKTLGAALDPVWLQHTRAELRWVGEALGGVRDCDVLGTRLSIQLSGQRSGDPSEQGLADALADRRRRAVAHLAEVVESDRYLALLDRLEAAAHQPPFLAGTTTGGAPSRHPGPNDRASRVLPSMVGDQWRRLRRQVRRAGAHPTDHHLHRIRIHAKQLRYAAELSQPVIGKPARRTAKAAEQLQTILGEHHDAVVAEAWCRQVGLVPSVAGFAAGRRAERQARLQRRLRGRWRPVGKQLQTKKHSSWLD